MINKELIVKTLLILFIVIIGSVILVRSVNNGQTLSDYAEKNNIPIHSETTVEEFEDAK